MTFEEFQKKMEQIAVNYPFEAEKVLKNGANKLKKKLKENTPIGPHKTKKLKDGWRTEAKGITSRGLSVDIKQKSPHWHLVEKGHVQYDRKHKPCGFVQGTFFTEKTKDAVADELYSDFQKRLYRALRRKGVM